MEGTEVLWEEKLSYYDLMVMRLTEGEASFNSEEQNEPINPKEELAKASAKAGLYLPIEEVPQTSDKTMRIQTMQPDVKNHYIKFNKRHKRLLEQMEHFPMGAHDDGVDALEGCRTIAKKMKRFRVLDKGKLGL